MSPWLVILSHPVTIFSAMALFGLAVAAIAGAWREHTPVSKELAADVDASLTAAGKHGYLAEEVIGMSAPKLSRALNVGEPLNLWRLSMLPDAFWLTFIQRIAARYGAIVILPEQVEVLRGAAAVGTKRMARMGLFPQSERKAV